MAYSSDPFSSAMMSLPTPPGTSHREEKENRSFTFQPASRVVWSEQNEVHTLPSPLSPIQAPLLVRSVHKRPPAKSILKKTNHALPAIEEEEQREETPEPEDPMIDLNYLENPVSRIIAPDTPLRALIESYSILAARLRACVGNKTNVDSTWPLFRPIRANREAFVGAIVRDLARVLEDPLELVVATEPQPEVEPSVAPRETERETFNKGLPSPRDSPKKKKKRGMTEEQVKYARDLSTTSQTVIKFVSIICVLPGLYQMFTDKELGFILTQILAMPLAETLPTPNNRKSWSLSIWFLQVQRLPEHILEPASDRIARSLQRALDGELGKEGKKGCINDALKAINSLSVAYPLTFVPAFTPVLPSILECLIAPTLHVRSLACHALGGFAYGSAHFPTCELHTHISDYIVKYVLCPVPGTPSKRTILPTDDSALVRTLRTTLQQPPSEVQYAPQGPVWALSVLASLVVLLRGAVFHTVKVARALAALFSLAMRQKKSSVRGLSCLVWRTMTWAYLQPAPVKLRPQDDQSQVDELEDPRDPLVQEKERRRLGDGWKIISSVADMGAGTATISGLLGYSQDPDERDYALRQALMILKIMSKRNESSGQDTLELLVQLLHLGKADPNVSNEDGADGEERDGGGFGGESTEEAKEWDHMKLLVEPLFSCYPGLMTTEYQSISGVVRAMFHMAPQVEDVRWLTPEELSSNFVVRTLVDAWKEGLRALRLHWGVELPWELREIFARLIKVKVRIAKESGDEEALVQVADFAVEILIEVFEDNLVDLSPPSTSLSDLYAPPKPPKIIPKIKAPLYTRMKPALKLFLIDRLWTIAKAYIPKSALGEAAGRFLKYLIARETATLGKGYSADAIHELYGELCSSIAVVCEQADFETFWTFGRAMGAEWKKRYEWTVDAKPMIWSRFAQVWEDEGMVWEVGVVILSVPFRVGCSWTLSGPDLDIWENVLKQTINRALDLGVDSFTVLDQISSSISSQKSGTIATLIRVADILLSNFDIDDARQAPEDLLQLVERVLLRSYPPPNNDCVPSMWLIRSMTRLVDGCSMGISRDVFEKVMDGVSVWISDEYGVLSEDDYSFNILPLYQTLLLGIRTLPKSLDVLEVFASLIHSAFAGSSTKHEGTFEAFQEFWQASGYEAIVDDTNMPEIIALCLERINAPPIPTTTQDITEHDASAESISDPMEVDEVEKHLTRPTTPESEDEEDIAMCLSPEIQEITKEVFMHSRYFAPSTPSRSDVLEPPQSPTPARSRITSMTKLSVPGRPKKCIESSSVPTPIPSFSLRLVSGESVSMRTGSKASTPSTPGRSPEVRASSQPSTSTLGSSSNKENLSPYFTADITSERTSFGSPGVPDPAPVTPTTRQGVLGKRRSIDMDVVEEDEVVLVKRPSSSVGSGLRMSKARAAKGMRKSSGSFSKVSLVEENGTTLIGSSRSGKSPKTLPDLKPFPKLPEVNERDNEKDASAPEEQTPPQDGLPKSRKRKGVFMDAVELPLRRSVRRRTESMPEPRSSSPAPSTPTTSRTRTLTLTLTTARLGRGPVETQTQTPRPPVSLRRTRSATRLLGMNAAFEKLPSTPTKKSKGKKRASGIVGLGLESESSQISEEKSSVTEGELTSSPLRILREGVVAGSDDSIMLATPSKHSPSPPDLPSSDDLPFLGLVTPRRLISPAMKRISESISTDSDPPSDDSILTASPSRDRAARRSGFNGATPAPSLFTHSSTAKARKSRRASGSPSPLRRGIKRTSISSLFGIDGETLSY